MTRPDPEQRHALACSAILTDLGMCRLIAEMDDVPLADVLNMVLPLPMKRPRLKGKKNGSSNFASIEAI